MRISVFCSAKDLDSGYAAMAREFGERLGRNGHTLVWGGSDTGTMKVVADAVRTGGGKLVGVSVEVLRSDARADSDEMVFMATLAERKQEMLRRADAVAVLPGGTGTLDEATEAIELKKLGEHTKPIGFLNTKGFYEGVRTQLAHMEAEGFVTGSVTELVAFVDTPDGLLDYLETHGA